MRKLFFVNLCIIVLMSSLFLFSCGSVELKNHSHTYISEYRKNLFANKTGNLLATFTSGEREKDYDLTGVKTPLVSFGVLTVIFDIDIGESTSTFELCVNDKIFTGELERNPYDGSYVYDIQEQVEDDDTITLKINELDQNLKLVCLSASWHSTWEDAVSIFSQKYNSEIASHSKEGKFLGEIYVKIVSKTRNLENIYWYVLCVCQDGKIYSCLVDVNTNEIVQS